MLLIESETTPEVGFPPRLPFPPVTRAHILHCSYHRWHPLYRTITPKARLIPLTDPFLSYLRSDGIILPPEDNTRAALADDDSGIYSFSEASDSGDDEELDPSAEWREIHSQIKATIAELGGQVTPKLNWSAPKDAMWITTTNDLQCRTANDVYLLLKSSDFITHDLEHALDDCETGAEVKTSLPALASEEASSSIEGLDTQSIPYYLVLRKYFNLNPSLEFRCFVRNRTLLCMCQRDLNHFEFLSPMRDSLRARIQSFFGENLRNTFPDPNFVFDVYIPPPHDRVWLVDINPWAMRTDPLLFSWMEILNMKDPKDITEDDFNEQVVRLSLRHNTRHSPQTKSGSSPQQANGEELDEDDDSSDENGFSPPEFRLVKCDDPEAYGFVTPQFSAHKLPREVVDASQAGPGGMREFMDQWQEILTRQFQQEQEAESSDGHDD